MDLVQDEELNAHVSKLILSQYNRTNLVKLIPLHRVELYETVCVLQDDDKFMKSIDREVFNSLPTSFTSVFIANIVEMANNAKATRNEAAIAYALSENVLQRNQALESNARYEVCRDLLVMLGRSDELKSGNTNDEK